MLNVFVISSDKRVASLIDYFQPFFKTKIRCASDFDNGLKEVFENRPSVVFIQSTIGTVSGETVSRHIKSLLGSASPRIIFMGDFDSSSKKGTSWCDDWISVSDSEQQMQQDFAELISRSFPEDWREMSQEMKKNATSSVGAIQELNRPEEEIPAESSVLREIAADAEMKTKGESPDASRPVGVAAAPAADLPELQGRGVQEEAYPAYQKLHGEPFFVSDDSRPRLPFARKILSGLFLLAVVGGGIYFWLTREEGKTIPAVHQPAAMSTENAGRSASPPANNQSGIKGLPSFVRSEWRDALYTENHPDWERYLSPDADFRIYRKNDTIKALQGISRGRSGFADEYLSQILLQVGIEGPLPSGKESFENNFLVKTFVLPGVAELVTYQEQGTTQIKAFVLEFTE